MRKILIQKRSLLFAIAIMLGQLLALQMLKDYGGPKFLIVAVLTSCLICFEIYINWRIATKVLRQLDMPTVNVYNLWGHLLNHIVLPLGLFTSVTGFIYFNDDDFVRVCVIGINFFVNIVLLTNIHSYYNDDFMTEEKTHYIFDLVKLFNYFFVINLILHLKKYYNIDTWIIGLLVCFLSIGSGLLLAFRKGQQGLSIVTYMLITSFIISVLAMIIIVGNFVLIGVNVILFLLFYFVYAMLHHRLERTLTKQVFVEYCLTIVVALLILIGIS